MTIPLLAAISLMAITPGLSPDGHKPTWFDRTLAGYALAHDEKHSSVAVYDPNTHFMLIREPECDGADLTLLLTRDRPEVLKMGYKVPDYSNGAGEDGYREMVVKPLPSLATGKGIRIGDSPASVRSILGAQAKRTPSGSHNQYLTYTYSFTDPKHKSGRDYSQVYTFRAGRLVEIMFTWSVPDREDDKAVVQHAAKKSQSDRNRQ